MVKNTWRWSADDLLSRTEKDVKELMNRQNIFKQNKSKCEKVNLLESTANIISVYTKSEGRQLSHNRVCKDQLNIQRSTSNTERHQTYQKTIFLEKEENNCDIPEKRDEMKPVKNCSYICSAYSPKYIYSQNQFLTKNDFKNYQMQPPNCPSCVGGSEFIELYKSPEVPVLKRTEQTADDLGDNRAVENYESFLSTSVEPFLSQIYESLNSLTPDEKSCGFKPLIPSLMCLPVKGLMESCEYDCLKEKLVTVLSEEMGKESLSLSEKDISADSVKEELCEEDNQTSLDIINIHKETSILDDVTDDCLKEKLLTVLCEEMEKESVSLSEKDISVDSVKEELWEEDGQTSLDIIDIHKETSILDDVTDDCLKEKLLTVLCEEMEKESVSLSEKDISADSVKEELWEEDGQTSLDIIDIHKETSILDDVTASDMKKMECQLSRLIEKLMEYSTKMLENCMQTSSPSYIKQRKALSVNLVREPTASDSELGKKPTANELDREFTVSELDSELTASEQSCQWSTNGIYCPVAKKGKRQSAIAECRYSVKKMSGENGGSASGFSGNSRTSEKNDRGWEERENENENGEHDNDESGSDKWRGYNSGGQNPSGNLASAQNQEKEAEMNWKVVRKKHGCLSASPDGVVELLGRLNRFPPGQVLLQGSGVEFDFQQVNSCVEKSVCEFGILEYDEHCKVCLHFVCMLRHFVHCEERYMLCDICRQTFILLQFHLQICLHNEAPMQMICSLEICNNICEWLRYSMQNLSDSLPRVWHKVKKYLKRLLDFRENGHRSSVQPVVSRHRTPSTAQLYKPCLGKIPESPTNSLSLFSAMHIDPIAIAVGDLDVTQKSILKDNGGKGAAAMGDMVHSVDHETSSSEKQHGEPRVRKISFVEPLLPTSLHEKFHSIGRISRGQQEQSGHKPLQRKLSPAEPKSLTSRSLHSVNENEGHFYSYHKSVKRKISGNGQTPGSLENYSLSSYNSESGDGSLELNVPISLPAGIGMSELSGYQHFSFIDRPVGVPGIGEVAYHSSHQLKMVADYWAEKKVYYEDNKNWPRHLREEGIILKPFKRNFCIGGTRYQKKVQWMRLTHLGNGMTGKCHLAVDQSTKFKFCVKRIHLRQFEETELKIWSELKHPNIVTLYGALRLGEKIYILCEFVDGGCLTECINQQREMNRRISHWMALTYFKQILTVLVYLQGKGILHEDLKADNILLRQQTTEIVVADFGLAHRINTESEMRGSHPFGTQTQWSPEKAQSKGYSFPSDMWSAFCVLIHMFSGDPPWIKRFSEARILHMIISEHSPPMEDVPKNINPDVVNLIRRGFTVDPSERPSAAKLLKDPAFNFLDQSSQEILYSVMTSAASHSLDNKLVMNDSEFEALSQALDDKRAIHSENVSSMQLFLPQDTIAEAATCIEKETSSSRHRKQGQVGFPSANSSTLPFQPVDSESLRIKTFAESEKENAELGKQFLNDDGDIFGVPLHLPSLPVYSPKEKKSRASVPGPCWRKVKLSENNRRADDLDILPNFNELVEEKDEIFEKECLESSEKKTNINNVDVQNQNGIKNDLISKDDTSDGEADPNYRVERDIAVTYGTEFTPRVVKSVPNIAMEANDDVEAFYKGEDDSFLSDELFASGNMGKEYTGVSIVESGDAKCNESAVRLTGKHGNSGLHLDLTRTSPYLKRKAQSLVHSQSQPEFHEISQPFSKKPHNSVAATPRSEFPQQVPTTGGQSSSSGVFMHTQSAHKEVNLVDSASLTKKNVASSGIDMTGSSTPKSSSTIDKQEAQLIYWRDQSLLPSAINTANNIETQQESLDLNRNERSDEESMSYVLQQYMQESPELNGTVVTLHNLQKSSTIKVRYHGVDLHKSWREILDHDLIAKIRCQDIDKFNLHYSDGVLIDLDDVIPSQHVDLFIMEPDANAVWWAEMGMIRS